MSVYDWSTVAADNGTADPNINWQEQQNSNTVNNSSRAEMAAIAAFLYQIGAVADSTGTGNAYAAASPAGNALTAYKRGNIIGFVADRENTGPATLAVDGLAAVPLKNFGSKDVLAGGIDVGAIVIAIYDGTNFQIITQAANANIQALGAVTAAADLLAYFDSDMSMATTALTAFARTLLDDTSASAMRGTLGLGTAATANTGTGASNVPTRTQADARYLLESNNLSDLTNDATARNNLGLGSNAERDLTISTAAPSGGSNGDVWFRYS